MWRRVAVRNVPEFQSIMVSTSPASSSSKKELSVPEEESTIIVRNVENRLSNPMSYSKTLELSTMCLFKFLVLLYGDVIVGYTECVQQNIRIWLSSLRGKIMIIWNVRCVVWYEGSANVSEWPTASICRSLLHPHDRECRCKLTNTLTTCSFEKIITESQRKSEELIKAYLSTSFTRRPTNAPAVTEDLLWTCK
jgi:hypothetical protein